MGRDELDREVRDALDASNAAYHGKPREWKTGWPGWKIYMRQVRVADALRAYKVARITLRRAIRGLLREIRKTP